MEIALHDESIEPFVELLPGGVVRLHAHAGLDLAAYFENQTELPHHAACEIRELWFNPEIERKFQPREGFVLISRAN